MVSCLIKLYNNTEKIDHKGVIMEYLYAPWRGTYLTRDNPLKQPTTANSCVFCTMQKGGDEENLILKRGKYAYILLNSYPYNPGHLLVVPYQHASSLEVVSKEVRQELMEMVSACITLLQNGIKNNGTNIGINLGGKAAGGTIPEHLHIHVLPRWEGDTNFLPTLAQTKQLSADLMEVYRILRPLFDVQVID
jgi:ATP adenylyltransferase